MLVTVGLLLETLQPYFWGQRHELVLEREWFQRVSSNSVAGGSLQERITCRRKSVLITRKEQDGWQRDRAPHGLRVVGGVCGGHGEEALGWQRKCPGLGSERSVA